MSGVVPRVVPIFALTLSIVLSAVGSNPAEGALSQKSKKTIGSAASSSASRKPEKDFVLFRVARYEDGVVVAEPIVMLKGGVMVEPPIDEPDVAATAAFIKQYFAPNKQYRVLTGGAAMGSITVKEVIEPACFSLTARVDLKTTVRIGGQVDALATTSRVLGGSVRLRRSPTEAERAEALAIVKKAYTAKGASDAQLKEIDVVNLAAVDLDGDGRWELTGNFLIPNTSPEEASEGRGLFLLAVLNGEAYEPKLLGYYDGTNDLYRERLVDHVDLDGDGVSELITQIVGYESFSYRIYTRKNGQWVAIYNGGESGC